MPNLYTCKIGFMAMFLVLVLPLAGKAEVIREDIVVTTDSVKIPLYKWTDKSREKRGVVLAVHGATLHGRAYETFGRLLANNGYIVLAPDLRGFGHHYHAAADKRPVYEENELDLVALLRKISLQYPSLPIICLGESVGGHLALRVASSHPQLMNGIVLSSSSTKCIFKNHLIRFPTLVKELSRVAVKPKRQLDLSPYIKRYISEDPRIAEERLSDPLGRNNLSATQLMKFVWMSRRTIARVPDIPAHMPVLILQGTYDQLYKPEGVKLLAAKLKSNDKTIRWFPGRGHILLETKYVQPEALQAVVSWLDNHTAPPNNLASEKQLHRTD